MNHSKSVITLTERATVKVAINLCQSDIFKGMVLSMRESTDESSQRWSECEYYTDDELLERWNIFVNEYGRKATIGFPSPYKYSIQYWISRIAQEYLSYCRRMGLQFNISQFVLKDFLTERDWTESGRIDELTVAKRLIEYKEIEPLQRYLIVCFYFLHADSMAIQLWNMLSPEEKNIIATFPTDQNGNENLFNLGSPYLFRPDLNIEPPMFQRGVKYSDFIVAFDNDIYLVDIDLSIYYGNVFAIKSLFSNLSDETKNFVVQVNLSNAIDEWLTSCFLLNEDNEKDWLKILLSNKNLTQTIRAKQAEESYNEHQYILLNHYTEVVCFFLLQMDDAMQLYFFQKFFARQPGANILKVFLEWPHQNYFLPVMRQLWGILPKSKFLDCLFTIANKYPGYYDWKNAWTATYWRNQYYNEYQCCDYRSLLWDLWHETPEDYKRYVFTEELHGKDHDVNVDEDNNYEGEDDDEEEDYVDEYVDDFEDEEEEEEEEEFEDDIDEVNAVYKSGIILTRLFQWCPLADKDKELFKLLLPYVPVNQRVTLMRTHDGRIKESGKEICSALALNENLSFADWLLSECLPNDLITLYKKEFVLSSTGIQVCLYKLEQSRVAFLEELFDWCGLSEGEKMRLKANLLYWMKWSQGSKTLLEEKGFEDIERMIEFCFSSEEEKDIFRRLIVEYSCEICVSLFAYDISDTFLTWLALPKEKITMLKKKLICNDTIARHHCNLIFSGQLEEAKRLCQWCGLSSEEERKLTNDLPFSNYFINKACEEVQVDLGLVFNALRYCIVDKQALLDFRNKLESFSSARTQQSIDRLKNLLSRIFKYFK